MTRDADSGHSTANIAPAVISAKTSQSIMAQGLHHGARRAKMPDSET
jgi:hypothetical protein